MFGLDTFEILVIVLLAVVLFGRKLPEVTRALGRGVSEFRKGLREIEDEIRHSIDTERSVSPGPARKPEANVGVPHSASDKAGAGFDFYDKAPAEIGPTDQPTGGPNDDGKGCRTKPGIGDDRPDYSHGNYQI